MVGNQITVAQEENTNLVPDIIIQENLRLCGLI